jgi:uncharacterized protein YggT (Ycf19 family)
MSNGTNKAMYGGLRLTKVLVWLVYAYLIVAVIILVLAFFLLLFAANPDAEFTQWVYRTANRALSPFWGIFPTVEADNGSVLDFAVVFAIIMYGILALVVHALVEWLDSKIIQARRRNRLAEKEYPATPPPAQPSVEAGAMAPPPPPLTPPPPPPQPPSSDPNPPTSPPSGGAGV